MFLITACLLKLVTVASHAVRMCVCVRLCVCLCVFTPQWDFIPWFFYCLGWIWCISALFPFYRCKNRKGELDKATLFADCGPRWTRVLLDIANTALQMCTAALFEVYSVRKLAMESTWKNSSCKRCKFWSKDTSKSQESEHLSCWISSLLRQSLTFIFSLTWGRWGGK